MCFKLTIIHVVHCICSWQCGTHSFWVAGSNLLLHMVSTSVFIFSYFRQNRKYKSGEKYTTLTVSIYNSPNTHFLSSLIVPWFVTCRPPYLDPFMFYDFNYDKLTHMKGWMVGLSYHWMLYLIVLGRVIFTYIQYDYPPPFFIWSERLRIPFYIKLAIKG